MPIYVPGKVVLKKESVAADPYYNKVSLLLHGDGANGSTTIVDSSPTPKTVTAEGDAQISTAQSKFGGSSIAFDGSGDYLSATSSTDFAFGTGDFTVEGWIRPTAFTYTYNTLFSTRGTAGTSSGFNVGVSNSGSLFFYTNNFNLTCTSSVLLNMWTHFAFVRSSGTLKAYSNGICVGTVALANDFTLQNCYVASVDNTENWTGYLQDFRITKGIARYSSNFTPPTAPFPEVLG